MQAQLKAHDGANLQKQKDLLETLAKEYEIRVNRLKKTISAKRGYLKALQMDIQKYQKKNEDFTVQIINMLENQSNLIGMIIPTRVDLDEIKWHETEA